MTIKTLEEAFAPQTQYSPYSVIKILNQYTGWELPTQMGYNYVKKGMITSTLSETGKLQVSREAAITWCAKYIAKRTNTTVAVPAPREFATWAEVVNVPSS